MDRANQAGQPMVDVIIYNEDIKIGEVNTENPPNYIIEITKNDEGDSGNQCYQRIEKFSYCKLYWGERYNQINKFLLYTIYIENKSESIPFKISNELLNIFGVKVLKINMNTNIINRIQPNNDNLESFLKLNNSTRAHKTSINNRIVYNEEDNSYVITTNLIHNKKKREKSNIHDPNTGYIVGVCAFIHKHSPDSNIIVTEKCGLFENHINNKSKLWTCLKLFSGKMQIYDNTNKLIEKDWHSINAFPNYIKEPSGEKLSSMRIHLDFELNENFEIMFHNHAGCERSFLNINNEYLRCGPKNIPDLVVRDKLNKKIYIIEAKINNKVKIAKGEEQLRKSRIWFDINVTDNEEILTSFEDYTIEEKICVYSQSNGTHPTYLENKLMLSLKENGDNLTNYI